MYRRFAVKQFCAAVKRFCTKGHRFKFARGLAPRSGLLKGELFMLKNMSIGMRLAIGFGLIVLLLVTIAFSGYWGLEGVTGETLKVLNGDAKIVILSARVKTTTLELRRYEKDTELNMDDPQVRNDYAAKWREQRQKIRELLTEFEKYQLSPED